MYNAWDPSAPRSPSNFNPFETWEGNSPDASGFYPGEVRFRSSTCRRACVVTRNPASHTPPVYMRSTLAFSGSLQGSPPWRCQLSDHDGRAYRSRAARRQPQARFGPRMPRMPNVKKETFYWLTLFTTDLRRLSVQAEEGSRQKKHPWTNQRRCVFRSVL